MCVNLCNDDKVIKNCSKTVLVDIKMNGVHDKTLRAYAIIDEQANVSLVDDKVISFFGRKFPTREYCLNFASQNYEISTSGQIVSGLKVSSITSNNSINLPPLLSTPNIANTKDEIASPSIVKAHQHISHLASYFNEVDNSAEVLLLIGRDCGEAMATRCYGKKEPFANKTPLGWALVGKTCISSQKQSPRILRTSVCTSDHPQVKFEFSPPTNKTLLVDPFETQSNDENMGTSREDRRFLEIMRREDKVNERGNIEFPIPSKTYLPFASN